MTTDQLIAKRYIFSSGGVSLISTLTFISIGGVTIGTALLIIVLSVFNGFYDLIRGLLLDYDPDIRITSSDGTSFYRTAELDSVLSTIPTIHFISPYVEGKCLITTTDQANRVVSVRGVDPKSYYPFLEQDIITSGEFDLSMKASLPGAVLSESLVNELRIYMQDDIRMISADGVVKSLTQFSGPRSYRFDIRGYFSFNEMLRDELVLIDLPIAQRLFYTKGRITGIDLKISNPEQAEETVLQLSRLLGDNYTFQTWYDLKKPLYDVMQLEKWASYFILMIIVAVAVLNIVGSLTMIVVQKRREIGMLAAIGYTSDRIARIFRLQGVMIGLIGCLLGGSIGVALAWLQKEFGLVKLAGAESFIINAYPIMISVTDIAIVLTGSLLLCIAASLIPAKRAAFIEPAVSLRSE